MRQTFKWDSSDGIFDGGSIINAPPKCMYYTDKIFFYFKYVISTSAWHLFSNDMHVACTSCCSISSRILIKRILNLAKAMYFVQPTIPKQNNAMG
jgi:hypothetical protein